MGTLNKNTIEKREIIKSAGYKHVEVYECQLKNNKDFQKFVKNYNKEIVEPLNPRDAFYGVRFIQQFNIVKNIRLVTL